jgi:hypothetical protein
METGRNCRPTFGNRKSERADAALAQLRGQVIEALRLDRFVPVGELQHLLVGATGLSTHQVDSPDGSEWQVADVPAFQRADLHLIVKNHETPTPREELRAGTPQCGRPGQKRGSLYKSQLGQNDNGNERCPSRAQPASTARYPMHLGAVI